MLDFGQLDTSFLWNTIATILYLFLFAYLPGSLLTSAIPKVRSKDLALVVGMSTLALLLFFGRWLLPTVWILGGYLFLIGVVVAINYASAYQKIFSKVTCIPWWAISAIGIGVIAQSSTFIQSGLRGWPSIAWDAYATRDQSWHIALITELTHHFPPQVPGYAGALLTNYHYFLDLLLAGQLQIFGGDASILMQGLYPLVFSVLYGLIIYRLASHLISHTFIQFLAIILGYLSNNLSYLVGYLGIPGWRSDLFLLDQPIQFLYNQQTVWSVVIVGYLVLLLSQIFDKKKISAFGLPIVILWASLLYVKIYAWVIVTGLLFLTVLYWVYRMRHHLQTQRKFFLQLVGMISIGGIIGIGIYGLGFEARGEFINFNPGWVVTAFYEKILTPYFPKVVGLMAIYTRDGVWLKKGILWFIIGGLFWVGNLGFRLLSLGYVVQKKKDTLGILLLVTVIISFGLTMIGNQSNSAFNIVQFAPYGMIFSTVLSLSWFDTWYRPTAIWIGVLLGIAMLSLPVSVHWMAKTRLSEVAGYSRNGVLLPKENLVLALESLQDQPYGAALALVGEHNGHDWLYTHNWLGAIARQRNFLGDIHQLGVLQLDYKERKAEVERFRRLICQPEKVKPYAWIKTIHYVITESNWGGTGCLQGLSSHSQMVYRNPDYIVIKM